MIVRSRKELFRRCRIHKKRGESLVLATGVFDVLHQEHINFLRQAKKAGNVLVVGLESDRRVRAIKGEGRPINTQAARLKNLQRHQIADYVFVLPVRFNQPEQHDDLIARIKPDTIAVSSHTSHLDKKRAIIEKHHGQLRIVHQHNPKLSTSILINRNKHAS